MILEYHRPKTLDEALSLLARAEPRTYPLGGGTLLNRPSPESCAVVDLQGLGLNKIHKAGNNLEIGATVTLQALLESAHTPIALKEAIKLETTYNLRQMATAAGILVACDGRSPFATAMLALDTKVTVESQEPGVVSLGDLLPLRQETLQGKLITKITIPTNVRITYEYAARTPADRPIVCAALAQWPSGRTRLALGGWGKCPTLAMDGNEPGGVEAAAKNAFHEAGDEWASAEYRSDVAAVLAKRCAENMK